MSLKVITRAQCLRAENADSVAIDENVEVQVLDTMSQLSQANKKQCVALIVS